MQRLPRDVAAFVTFADSIWPAHPLEVSWSGQSALNHAVERKIDPDTQIELLLAAFGEEKATLDDHDAIRLEHEPLIAPAIAVPVRNTDQQLQVTGEDTGGAFDYFIVEVAPKGGPPLHVHHKQEETIHALKGRYKIQIGDQVFTIEEGGFAYLPSNVPHAFLNLSDQEGEIVVVYTPGGGHKFYEELGPATRSGTTDRATIAAIFEKYDMTLLGPPLSAD